ncbi:MAG TPA: hypothetical protein VEC06_14770 [Paucimonas sp.]|nr:hypothetical protein [Paucimonas sp.]
MKHFSLGSMMAMARDVGHAFIALAAAIVGALMRMPLPRLLLVCVVAALVFTILPLAITLFLVALIVKLVAAAVAHAMRPRRPRLERLDDTRGERP